MHTSLYTTLLTIIVRRITKFAIEQNILSGNKTPDAHLIVHNLVNYYCTKEKKHTFGCFVDFQKAFDSVPRNKLFQKLLDYNINGKFYDCLTNLYTGDKSCVKLGDRVTSTFELTHRVKQGCILSPILFNIFLSDLQQELEQKYCNPVNISSSVESGCLIWADDLLHMSRTEIGLQNMLNALNNYTSKNGMTLNIEKTKVMIFNKSGRHMRRQFYFGENKIETRRQYKYLGFMMTPLGETTTGLKDLKDSIKSPNEYEVQTRTPI